MLQLLVNRENNWPKLTIKVDEHVVLSQEIDSFDADQIEAFLSLNENRIIKKEEKKEKEKLRWDLLPWDALESLARVMTLNIQKHGEDSWRELKNPCQLHWTAIMRHLIKWWRGEKIDPETGESHLAHAGCRILFLISVSRNNLI
jgi:hypothetical protein